MAYTKQTWADLPSKTTPINANRLTHIEDGIFNAAQTADTAASTAGTAAANIGIVSGRVETLTGRVNGLDTAVSNKVDKVTGKGLSTNDYDDTDKGKVDSLGTASTKNSTSVVTSSSDLVESGAVYDALGFGNKNIGVWNNVALSGDTTSGYKIQANGSSLITPIKNNTDYTVSKKSTSFGNRFRIILFKNEPSTTPSLEAVVITDDVTRTESTFNSGVYNYVVFTYDSATVISQDTAEAMIELGSVKTAYELYHASVSDSLAEKADNSVIGTVEDGTNPTKSYAVDEFMVRDGAFCQVTAPVTTSSTWTEGSNYTKKSIAEVLQSLMS